MELDNERKKLDEAIKELENSFWDVEEVHDIEVRLDAVNSAIEDFVPDLPQGLEFPIAVVGEPAIGATRVLLEYSEAVSYGESILDQDDLDDANEKLDLLRKALEKWLSEQPSDN